MFCHFKLLFQSNSFTGVSLAYSFFSYFYSSIKFWIYWNVKCILQIQWFWRALRSFDQAARAKFLQFVTGTSKVPLQGFAALEGMNGVQKFQIHRDDRSTDRLPSAHTWYESFYLCVWKLGISEHLARMCSWTLRHLHFFATEPQ
jgi:hypothetical protein